MYKGVKLDLNQNFGWVNVGKCVQDVVDEYLETSLSFQNVSK
jgi:hypothetical protein